nr:reverse transcriptase domain-containing protein [Tanacetum cinerariifolium]
MVGENHSSWSDNLDDALWAFRTAFKTPIGCTPSKLVYGKSCHLPIELEHKAYWALNHSNFDLKTMGDQAYKNYLIYKERTKKFHDSKIKNRIFNVGDQVLLFNSRLKIFSGKLKTRCDCVCSIGTVEDNILILKPPKNYARCTRYGYLVDGPNCQGCALLRQELEENLVTHSPDFQNTSEPSNASTNVVNALREPYVVKQDNGNVLRDGEACKRCTCEKCGSGLGKGLCYICSHNQNSLNEPPSIFETSSQSPPNINHCCYECGDPLDGIFCKRCNCKSCGKDAHIGYNFPSKVPREEKRIEEEQAAKAQSWKLPVCYDDDDDEEGYNSLNDNIISKLPPYSTVTPTEPIDSLSMGDEHLNPIPATESDEFIKSCVENLVPNPSESEGEFECDVPAGFTTFSNVLFDADYDSDSSDDQSLSDEDVPEKIYSNPLFDEEIISMEIDKHSFNTESDLIESMPNHDSSITISLKIDSFFDEIASELTLLKSFLTGINETNCHPEKETHFTKILLYENSSPRPPEEIVSENSNADIESFSPSPIPVKDSDSQMEEIDLSFDLDDPMPSGIEEDDDDSKRDIPILEKLLDDYSLSLFENKSYHFDIPSPYRPPTKPPDGNTRTLNIKMLGDVSDQKVPIPNLTITRILNQEKSPDLLSYLGLKAFQPSAECPMIINGKNIPLLGVSDKIMHVRCVEEEPTNYALMAFTSSSSSSSNNEVASCSKACTKAYATLQSHYDNLTNDVRKSQFDVISYKTGLESAEARLLIYQQNETTFEEDIKLLKLDVELRDNALVALRQKFEEVEQERDELKLRLEKFQTSSKNLSQLLAIQTNDKTGLGYDNQVFNSYVFDCDEMFSSESDVSMPASPIYDMYQSGIVYHVVPPPYRGTFMPPKPDLPVEHLILATNLRKDSPKSKGLGNNRNRKACFVCKSLTHLIKDCDYYEKKIALLTRSKLVPLTAVRLVTTDVFPNNVIRPRPAKTVGTKPHSSPRRTINRRPSPPASNFPLKVTTVKAFKGNPQHALKDNGVIDSGCSRHMTRNMFYLTDFKEINGRYAFGGNPMDGKITGKGKIRTGKLDFDDVYFVKELKFNLFSVLQMCDKKNGVLFTDTECIVLSPEFKLPDKNKVLLRVPRENNM